MLQTHILCNASQRVTPWPSSSSGAETFAICNTAPGTRGVLSKRFTTTETEMLPGPIRLPPDHPACGSFGMNPRVQTREMYTTKRVHAALLVPSVTYFNWSRPVVRCQQPGVLHRMIFPRTWGALRTRMPATSRTGARHKMIKKKHMGSHAPRLFRGGGTPCLGKMYLFTALAP